jgi:hypothetical protein
MKPVAVLIVACALGGGCFRDALLTTNPEDDPFPGDPKPVPPGSPLERDIASGHRQYETALASFGKWSSDPLYGVKWCPTMVDASTWVPYRSKGHWAAAEPPPGSPYWVSDDDEGAWGIITTHHGWWVYEEPPGSTSRWCWVPGAESTPARVVWRTGDGYVAWAPEPPPTDPDCDAADNDDLEWVFELIGTLLDDALDRGVLTGGAAHTASVATRRSREGRGVGHGNGSSRVGPPRKAVAEARSALSSYVAAHPGAAKPSSSEARSHGGAPTDTTVLPPSMAIYGQMTSDAQFQSASGVEGMPKLPWEAFHEPAGGAAAGGSSGRASSSSAFAESSGRESSGSSGRWASLGGGGGGSAAGGSSGHVSSGHTSSGYSSGYSSSSHSSSGDGGCGEHGAPAHTAVGHK